MNSFIIATIVTIVLFFLLGLDSYKDHNNQTHISFKLRARQLFALVGALIVAFDCFTVIPVNNVGIKFSVIGGVSENTLKEGFQVKSPLDKVYLISSEIQTVQLKDISGQTLDAQWVKMDLDVKYKVNPKNAFIVFKNFRTLDNVDKQLILPITQRAIEQVTTQYNVIDVLGEKRNEVYSLIEQEMKTKLAESGIDFFSLTLMDTDAGADIEAAIAREAIAKKEVETALQAKEKAKVEAETQLVSANAAAEIKKIEAQAEADANRIISESINENILRKLEMDARLKHGWIEVNTNSAIVSPDK